MLRTIELYAEFIIWSVTMRRTVCEVQSNYYYYYYYNLCQLYYIIMYITLMVVPCGLTYTLLPGRRGGNKSTKTKLRRRLCWRPMNEYFYA